MKRFARTELLLGHDGLERLRRAKVTVVGLGAVGSYAVEGLARAGVGHLRLIDFDVVRETNINRQLYALDSTLGQQKVDIARRRVLDINPNCQVATVALFINVESVPQVFTEPIDVLIDAIDSVGPKIELISAAVARKVFIVSSMGAATRTDPSAIRVADISETRICPLAQFVRKRLRKRGVHKGVRCIYSTEPAGNTTKNLPEPEIEETVDFIGKGRPRRPLGSLSCITGMFGLIAAREAIFQIVKQEAKEPVT